MNAKTYQVIKTCDDFKDQFNEIQFEIVRNLKKGDINQSRDPVRYVSNGLTIQRGNTQMRQSILMNCGLCYKEFDLCYGVERFCSVKCHHIHLGLEFVETSTVEPIRTLNCLYCGLKLDAKTIRRICCDPICKAKYHRKTV